MKGMDGESSAINMPYFVMRVSLDAPYITNGFRWIEQRCYSVFGASSKDMRLYSLTWPKQAGDTPRDVLSNY